MLLALRLASSIGMFARGSKNSKVLAALRLEFTRPCAWAGTTISTFDANAIQTGKAAPPNVAAFFLFVFLFVGEMTVPRVCRQAAVGETVRVRDASGGLLMSSDPSE